MKLTCLYRVLLHLINVVKERVKDLSLMFDPVADLACKLLILCGCTGSMFVGTSPKSSVFHVGGSQYHAADPANRVVSGPSLPPVS